MFGNYEGFVLTQLIDGNHAVNVHGLRSQAENLILLLHAPFFPPTGVTPATSSLVPMTYASELGLE